MKNIFTFEIIGNDWVFYITPMSLYLGQFKSEHTTLELNGKMRSGVSYKFLFFKLFVRYFTK